MKTNDRGHTRSRHADSVLCSYHFENQRCCGCQNCLKLILKTASWKPEKLCVFHCNDCGGTTIREIRSLYIDRRPRQSYSMNQMQHEWQCSHCDFSNSDSGTISIHKNTNLLDAENLYSQSQTISNTSVFTSASDLYKQFAPSCSYHSQKCYLSIPSNSVQGKNSKEGSRNLEKCAKNDECGLVIGKSQIGSPFMHRSKIEMEEVKWMTPQETSIVKPTNAVTAMASLKG